ncbi:hypothetical protein PH552_00275 [Rhizobium sp. CNPSo 3968]|uniref:hypothetical protein n=1 Tax=Rhizobium sp. CNPSo 3968 TaxID=3021408 RepID=UPI00254DB826|nr:hypothetical protein [Rhizobium sp. CNPSo 3968]MDK4717783.1 hypothetical protein [Rhizobium sp. CNPSo 3968]
MIYEANRPFLKLYETSTSQDPKVTMGPGFARFEGQGNVQNDRRPVTVQGQSTPIWWVNDGDLNEIADPTPGFALPQIGDLEFYEDCDLGARALSGFLDAGGMNVEYLLLLAWAESGWTNTDRQGRDGADADLTGEIGPYRFDEDVWESLLNDTRYAELVRGYTTVDRLTPQAQCLFAAIRANRLQLILKTAGTADPAAWLLRVGHRIGDDYIVALAQMNDPDPISAITPAIPNSVIEACPKLFPAQQQTTKAAVFSAVQAEFESAKRAVTQRLVGMVQTSVVDAIIGGASPDMRLGALGLLDFIGKYEAAGNYNAVVDRVRNENNPQLTNMTIADVLDYQGGLGARNACGKYQIIQSTLSGNYAASGLSNDSMFNPDGQDQIGYHLLMAVSGGDTFIKSDGGQAAIDAFALKLAQQWAALPVLRAMNGYKGVHIEPGDSYYSGTGGNVAGATTDQLLAAIAKFQHEVLAAQTVPQKMVFRSSKRVKKAQAAWKAKLPYNRILTPKM